MDHSPPTLTRRATLLGLTSVLTIGRVSLALASAPTERRFVVVILRGALDGLSAVVPYADPGLAALRPEPVPPSPGQGQRDQNQPLLRKLALEAPGTYHHSTVVSNMAEAAAEEIGSISR